jgi:hypothetical protein
MSPIKLKPSVKTRKRGEKQDTITHYYIKNVSQKELIKELNKVNTKPKIKAKIRIELARRGIKLLSE